MRWIVCVALLSLCLAPFNRAEAGHHCRHCEPSCSWVAPVAGWVHDGGSCLIGHVHCIDCWNPCREFSNCEDPCPVIYTCRPHCDYPGYPMFVAGGSMASDNAQYRPAKIAIAKAPAAPAEPAAARSVLRASEAAQPSSASAPIEFKGRVHSTQWIKVRTPNGNDASAPVINGLMPQPIVSASGDVRGFKYDLSIPFAEFEAEYRQFGYISYVHGGEASAPANIRLASDRR